MAAKKQKIPATGSRQAAYLARNRAALIRAAQEVLADIGPTATIEDLAIQAQVSPTTIYKYFENKEVLFSEALAQIWEEWVVWAYNGVTPGENLEVVIDTARKLFRVKKTHPLFAKILHNTSGHPQFILNAVRGSAVPVFRSLADRGLVKGDEFEKRVIALAHSLAGILNAVHVTEEFSPKDADVALGIALSLWGVSEAKAKKIVSRPLDFAPLNYLRIVE